MPDRLSRKPPSYSHSRAATVVGAVFALVWAACSSSPQPQFKRFAFPKNAYSGDIQRPYIVLGPVRSRVDYPSLDVVHEEKELCHNYFNKAARDLVKYAKKQGADAVIDVKSVVFLVDGRTELHQAPECSDDGATGQVLAQGIAVKWKGGPVEAGAWVSPLALQKAKDVAMAKSAKDVKDAKEAEALKNAVVWPTSTRPGMPMMPVGGTLVGDLDDDLSSDEPASEPAPLATEEPAQPTVTGRLEAYDPQQGLLSAPAAPLPRRPATVKSEERAEAPVSRPQLPPADPRAAPGRLRRALP